jgi:hypothetical protein
MAQNLVQAPSACSKASHELIVLRESVVSSDESSKKFIYPRDKILKFLNREKVSEILLCKCDKCKRHLQCLAQDRGSFRPLSYLDRIAPPEPKRGMRAKTAVSYFALMISLGYPLLIITLLDKGLYDGLLENFYTRSDDDDENEIREIQRWFKCLDYPQPKEEPRLLAEKLWEEVFSFAVPFLSNIEYVKFHRNTVLPFRQTKLLGEGSFGRVYAFEIYPYYNRLPVSFLFLRITIPNNSLRLLSTLHKPLREKK